MNQEIDLIAELLNQLAMKLLVAESALQATLGALPAKTKTAIAADLRVRVAQAMQAHAGRLSPAMDKQMTLSLAAYLEAAGHAPMR